MILFSSPSGDPQKTRMFNAETGEDISKLIKATDAKITIDSSGVSAVVTVDVCELDVTAGMTIFLAFNPVSKDLQPVRAFEFCDGSRVEIAEDGTPSIARKG